MDVPHILKLFFITMSQGIEVQKYNDWPTLPNLETNFIKNVCLTLFQFSGKDFGTIAPYLCSVNQSQVVDEAPKIESLMTCLGDNEKSNNKTLRRTLL